ncbi:hypothetical protein AVEN_25876-1 [Araneus ventricosus]|uniref:Uncharacterized protein n=1 Tax=Araneus ventricosus TaxID=182803 RepID=A0A4Y2F8A5_ARAVE|nr:hypothetical protein AVEN_25876-1 [Araneus ventricosus]
MSKAIGGDFNSSEDRLNEFQFNTLQKYADRGSFISVFYESSAASVFIRTKKYIPFRVDGKCLFWREAIGGDLQLSEDRLNEFQFNTLQKYADRGSI